MPKRVTNDEIVMGEEYYAITGNKLSLVVAKTPIELYGPTYSWVFGNQEKSEMDFMYYLSTILYRKADITEQDLFLFKISGNIPYCT